jgi:Asp-tRNA(Asn)/Glu-tRNA(Gln) amidotransferase A subunit family amidase
LAAALAAGFAPLQLGSDIGGSLRAPAHFCGVFSHKPALDLVAHHSSVSPQIPAVPVRGDLAVYGPMARSAVDFALELEILAWPDELMEGVGYKLELPPPRREKLTDFRVLVIDMHPLCPTADSIKSSLNGLADLLTKLGCREPNRGDRRSRGCRRCGAHPRHTRGKNHRAQNLASHINSGRYNALKEYRSYCGVGDTRVV